MLPGIREEIRQADRRRIADLLGIRLADLGRLKPSQPVTRGQLAGVTRKAPASGVASVVPIGAASGRLRRARFFPTSGVAKRTIGKGGK
jgi:hypothetical protein